MHYYHYTSRPVAQDIICCQPSRILPGIGGKVYLTPTRHSIGHKAANELAISNKPVEIGFKIPDKRVKAFTPLMRAQPVRGPGGIILRRGGGWEISTTTSIDATRVKWFSLQEP